MERDCIHTPPRPRIGIALSGGGARGFAHAGALAAVEEAGLNPDVIAGVSAGSIAAVLYAAGLPPKKLPEIFSDHSMSSFVSLRPGSGGFFSIEPFKNFLKDNLNGYENLEDLPIPVYLGVTDFDHGVPAEFHTGPIVERVAASCSIPIVFKPIEIDGVNYVDGGVLRNHPAWLIRDKCDIMIGVNVSPLNNNVHNTSFMSVAMRTYNLMAKANQAADMALCDVNIETPEIAHYRTFDLRFINNVYLSGYIHARKAIRDAGLWKIHNNSK